MSAIQRSKGDLEMTSAGIADPYWYEWYVGLMYVIKMLNPDSGIEAVVFQKGDYTTIDDVVVKYNNGTQMYCYQVKHEIASSDKKSLTFNELVKRNDKEKSLIQSLAEGWRKASSKTGNKIVPVLFTNKSFGRYKLKRTFKDDIYKAVPLGEFLIRIQEKIAEAGGSANLSFSNDEVDLNFQWMEFLDALDLYGNSAILFTKNLCIEASQPSLNELKDLLIADTREIFGCSNEVAVKLFNRLVAELPEWTTKTRATEDVTTDTVYETLSTKMEFPNDQHGLPPPRPFFESRVEYCRILVSDLRSKYAPVVFISGEPGSGKTSIISHIQEKFDFFTIRYHAFRPISPEQRFYNADTGLCKPRQLWTELLIQIRSKLKGKLRRYQVPVTCDHISDTDLRSKVIQLLRDINEETGKTVFICIDGIDHAARSNLNPTFLQGLYKPDEVPDGVCFVIVGQPPNLYQDYPIWIRGEFPNVKRFEIPPLIKDDVSQLIVEKLPQFLDCAERVAEIVFSKTRGNNLSVVYAIESLKPILTYEKLLEFSESGILSHDVTQYYDNIWQHVADVIIRRNIATNYAESKIAATILLLNGRIYTRILYEALEDMNLSLTEWDQLMDSLYPLVVPGNEEHEYNVFHNDFRVYLMSIASRHPKIYEELSFLMVQYFQRSEWGIIKYKNILPLLRIAKKTELAASYFDVKFVISALAEGLSYLELNEIAAVAYSEAVKSREIGKYHKVYLAQFTLHQHHKYYEYYDREYISSNYYDVAPHNIAEVRTKPIAKETVDEYYDVLVRCKGLYAADTPEMHRRAFSLYELWFNALTPVTLIRAIYPSEEYPDYRGYEVNVKELLRLWGEVCAKFVISTDRVAHHEAKELDDYESRAVVLFGDAYFSYFIEQGLYDEAVESIGNVQISINCVLEKLEDIMLNGKLHLFIDVIEAILQQKLEESEHLFTLMLILVADPLRQKFEPGINLDKRIKDTYGKNTMNAVAIAYIIGTINSSKDEIVILNQVYSILDIDDDSSSKKKEIAYLKLLMRIAALLGKYNCAIKKTPGAAVNDYLLYQQLKKFFDKPSPRSIDFSRAFRLLLFIILNTASVEKLVGRDAFFADLKHALLSFEHIGMHYKTIILDFLLKHERQDIVRAYLLTLYGEEGKSLFATEDWASTHSRFLKYSSEITPEVSSAVSVRQKWDVVSYVGSGETAIGMPLEIYKVCAEDSPEIWETQGVRLSSLSQVAENYSNDYSLDVIEELSENAIRCGMASFWKIHHMSGTYHFDLNILHTQLKHLLLLTHDEQGVTVIWILACGLLSWYDKYDHAMLRSIYDACVARTVSLGCKSISEFAEISTPTQYCIVSSESKAMGYEKATDNNDYLVRKKARLKEIEQQVSLLDNDEIIDHYLYNGSRYGEWYDVDSAWKEILNRNDMSFEIANRFMRTIFSRLDDRPWKYDGCDYIIKQLKGVLQHDAFWGLAEVIGTSLSEHDYQITVRNSSYLISLFSDLFADDVQSILDSELHCQELWITGNEHIPFPEDEKPIAPKLIQPRAICELALNILLEQLELNSIHRNEIALSGLYTLCTHNPSLFDWIVSNWVHLIIEQRNSIVLLAERWGREALDGVDKLIDVLREIYKTSNRLTEKMRLYSIIKKYDFAKGHQVKAFEFTANADCYVLTNQKESIPIDDRAVPNGLKAFLDINARFTNDIDSGRDIIAYIRNNVSKSERGEAQYLRSNDSFLIRDLGMSVIDPILYGEDAAGRWDHLPLEWRAQFFLDIDDAYVVTTPPTITYDEIWNIERELESCLNDSNYSRAESIAQLLIHTGLNADEQVFGSCLWYPIGYSENGIFILQTLKAILGENVLCSRRINQTFINYSVLSDRDNLYEHGAEDVTTDGVCLVRSIVGSAQFYHGNCQIYPANILQTEFKWKPLFSNPLVWVDDTGERALWFERILYPNRETAQQHYSRLPMLFRWIVDMRKLELQLEKRGLSTRSVYNSRSLSKVFQSAVE